MAITYQLNFTIDAGGVAAINGASQYITIVKQLNPLTSTSAGPPVAWLTFPAAQMITVQWEENYFLYATNAQLQAGATIVSTASTPDAALAQAEYTFSSDLVFGLPQISPNIPAGTFEVNNQVGNNTWQFGLAQKATINGSKIPSPVPLNIVPVLNNETATFTPEETVSIFLQSYSNNGVVLTQVAGNALQVMLSGTNPSVNIDFDDVNNTFYIPPSTTMMSKGSSQRRAALAATQR
ncbi:MAG TPA: hypothetical protein VF815_41600 [Myxococcaceae bacterium]